MTAQTLANGAAAPGSRPTRQPLLWAALAFSAGILLGTCAWRLPLWWMLATLAFISGTTLLLWQSSFLSLRLAKGLALGTLVLLGALNLQLRRPGSPTDPRILPLADGRQLSITAHVIKEGKIRSAGFGGMRQSVDIETEEIGLDGQSLPLRCGIRLGIYAREPKPEYEADAASPPMRIFRYGERISFTAALRPPRNFRNPGAFDYETYLHDNGINLLASTRAESVALLPGFAGRRIELWRTRLHRSVIAKVHGLWPLQQAVLMDAMVIGEEAFINRDERANFQRSGTYHILVVSGMNVSILAFVVFWTLRRLRAGEFAATVLTVLLSVAYAFLTDVGSPVWRAVLMMTIYLGTRLLFRQRSMLNAIGAAALGIMIVDPRVLLGASFQMTFLSVFIIAGIGAPLLDRLSQPYRRGLQYLNSRDYDLHLAPRVAQFRLDLRMVSGRLALFLPWRSLGERMALPALASVIRAVLAGFEVLFISFLMQLGLALPMAFYFHRAAVVGVPANALVVPLTGVLMPTAVLAVALGYVSPLLARIPALAAGAALEGIAGTVHSLGGLRVADLRVATPELPAILSAMAALAIAMILARSRVWLASLGLTVLLGSALWLSVLGPKPRLHPGMLEMTAIDVGQGDSILLVSPLGKMLLVDAGGPVGEQHSELDFGEDVVSPYLWSRGFSRLDAVAITHGHSDHMGGMHAVLANFRPQELWLGAIPPSQTLSQLLRQAKEQNITVVQHFQGDTFAFGGATVRVLAPARDWRTAPQPRNNDSLVLHVSYRESSVLMEGDAEKRIEEQISALQPHADVLKVAHHGGATSSIPELLQAVRPRMAVISVGARNSFGHPRLEILQRFEELGVATYRTDLDGAVTFYLDGRAVNPATAALR